MALAFLNFRNLRSRMGLAVGGALLALLLYRFAESRRTNRVLDATRMQGASATRDFNAPEWLEIELLSYPRLQEWLSTQILRINYDESRDGKLAPIDLSYVVDAPHLELLDARFAPEITDRDLSFVSQLQRLRHLEVEGPRITNEGALLLSRLANMEYLRLCNTAIDDEGLQFLGGMPRLRMLSLGGSHNVTGEGLKYLPKECRLEDLRVTATQYDHGLDQIDLSALTRFFADSSPLADAGLVHLRDAPALNQLLLRDTRITDDGLVHLAGLTQLEILFVSGTGVTQVGAERLAAQLPRVSIAYGPDYPHSHWTYGAKADKPE